MSHKLDDLLDDLQPEITPQRDLWAGIERQLDRAPLEPKAPKPTARPWLPWAMAASLLVTSLGSFWLGQQQGGNQDQQFQMMLQLMANQHQQQRQRLQSRFELSQFETVNDSQSDAEGSGIQTLRDAAEQLIAALKQDPYNPDLLELWLWVQQRELELMQKQQQRQQRLHHL
ncbi:hypothetical protein [Ferrimonas kyonanensis]|uniref:hypothetical protein n=1 Tax=Ferrimonas kyonanensis TaxID=364763 RepID=UPI00041F6DD6|nr:hypothetical protein [Ferrimonas kyonanensis]